MQPGKLHIFIQLTYLSMLSGNHLQLAVISDPLIACFMDMCTSMKDLEGRFLHQVIQRGKQLFEKLSFVRSACLGGQRLSAQRRPKDEYLHEIYTYLCSTNTRLWMCSNSKLAKSWGIQRPS